MSIFLKLYIKFLGTLLNVAAYLAPSYAAKKGYQLFCSPFNTKLKPSQEAFYETAEKERFTGEGIPEIQVYKWGNGRKKILFLHGWQSHAFRWIKYILAMKDLDYTVYAIDGPGHGNSDGKIMNIPVYEKVLSAFIHEYGNMDYYVGHSIGAFTIQYAFYKNPNLSAKAIVLLATPGNAQEFVDVYTKTLGLHEKAIKLIIDEFIQRFEHPPSYFTSARFATKLNVDGLIVHDRQDKEAPFHYAEAVSTIWNQSETYFTDGLKHKLKSPKVVKKVVDYIESK